MICASSVAFMLVTHTFVHYYMKITHHRGMICKDKKHTTCKNTFQIVHFGWKMEHNLLSVAKIQRCTDQVAGQAGHWSVHLQFLKPQKKINIKFKKNCKSACWVSLTPQRRCMKEEVHLAPPGTVGGIRSIVFCSKVKFHHLFLRTNFDTC